MKAKAFTLIELLVVIAIIAVLMGILMPSLKRAREQARSLHCRSNVRTLTMAWLMYKDENDAWLVSGHTPGPTGRNAWVRMPDSPRTASIEQKQEYIKRGLLWPYVKEVEVYRCPSDKRKNNPAHEYGYRTYSIAGGMNGVGDGKGSPDWEIFPCLTYTDIKQPATKYVFLAECDKRGYNNGSWVMYPSRKQWVDPFGIWHRDNTSTLGYADGHAEMQRWRGKGLIEWNLLALHEPAQFNFFRTPEDDEEWEDFDVMLKGYVYRQLQ